MIRRYIELCLPPSVSNVTSVTRLGSGRVKWRESIAIINHYGSDSYKNISVEIQLLWILVFGLKQNGQRQYREY